MRGPALAAIVVLVNENHDQLLGTPEWAAFLHDEVLPAATRGVDLGDDMLEIGPGPGAATSWLRERVRRLVAVDLSADSAAALRERFSGTNVSVVAGDATELGYPDGSCWVTGCGRRVPGCRACRPG